MMWWYDDEGDDDYDDDHDDATSSEQYVDWGSNINFIFMRDQHLPHPMNNMLFGVTTSTVSSWGSKICHPYDQYVDGGNNINFICIREQNSPPP